MCDKVQYTSKRHARLANRRNGKTLRTYVCDDCGYTHVTKWRGPDGFRKQR
jgi:uncharacterized protein YlaI